MIGGWSIYGLVIIGLLAVQIAAMVVTFYYGWKTYRTSRELDDLRRRSAAVLDQWMAVRPSSPPLPLDSGGPQR